MGLVFDLQMNNKKHKLSDLDEEVPAAKRTREDSKTDPAPKTDPPPPSQQSALHKSTMGISRFYSATFTWVILNAKAVLLEPAVALDLKENKPTPPPHTALHSDTFTVGPMPVAPGRHNRWRLIARPVIFRGTRSVAFTLHQDAPTWGPVVIHFKFFRTSSDSHATSSHSVTPGGGGIGQAYSLDLVQKQLYHPGTDSITINITVYVPAPRLSVQLPAHQFDLSPSYAKLLESNPPISSDVTIETADDVKIPAHTFILRVRSAILNETFDAKETATLRIPEKSTVVRALLEYIYTGKVSSLSTHKFTDRADSFALFSLANTYLLHELAELAASELILTLTTENAIPTLQLANRFIPKPPSSTPSSSSSSSSSSSLSSTVAAVSVDHSPSGLCAKVAQNLVLETKEYIASHSRKFVDVLVQQLSK